MSSSTAMRASERGGRFRPRSPALLVLLVLCGATAALADERVLEGGRQTATVFSAGGQRLTGGALVSTTVLAEGFVAQALTGPDRVMRVGFLAKKKLLRPSGGVDGTEAPAFTTRLAGNWPNPFNPATTVGFELGRAGEASLRVYDVHGRLVRTLVRGAMPAGRHEVRWDGRSDAGRPVASGLYLVEMTAPDYRARHKIVLTR